MLLPYLLAIALLAREWRAGALTPERAPKAGENKAADPRPDTLHAAFSAGGEYAAESQGLRVAEGVEGWAIPSPTGSRKQTPRWLPVGKELQFQSMQYGPAHRRIYRLAGLKASSCYEVKVSYPGTIGGRFQVQLLVVSHSKTAPRSATDIHQPGKSDVEDRHGTLRRLLDTEKTTFCVSRDGFAEEGSNLVAAGAAAVAVFVERTAVLPFQLSDGDLQDARAVFNIVCEELLLGLPRSSFPLLGTCILIAAFAVYSGFHFQAIFHFMWPELQKLRSN